jgi:hypothetical protein
MRTGVYDCAEGHHRQFPAERNAMPNDRHGFEPVSDDNKHAADDIEKAVVVPSSIEEEMMLEAAELEEAEYGSAAEKEPGG